MDDDSRLDDGFTLIELMVVVLVLAILMAIAIPTFHTAKGKATDSVAKSTATLAARNLAAAVAAGNLSVSTATATALATEESAITFLGGTTISTGPKAASVANSTGAWGAAVKADSGICYLVRSTTNGRLTYGDTATVAECTGTYTLLGATAPAWGAATTNLVTDGDFETGYADDFWWGDVVGPWYTASGTVQVASTATWAPMHGSYSVDLEGVIGGGSVQQFFATAPGSTYVVTMAAAHNGGCGAAAKTLHVAWAASQTATWSISGPSVTTNSPSAWSVVSTTFTATSNSADIQIFDDDNNTSDGCGVVIDMVSVTLA